MAKALGVSLSWYKKLERGEIPDPGIRTLQNCAIALGCNFADLIEEGWWEWWEGRGPNKPDRRELWTKEGRARDGSPPGFERVRRRR